MPDMTAQRELLMMTALIPVFSWIYLLICILQLKVCKKGSAAVVLGVIGAVCFYQTVRYHLAALTIYGLIGGFLLHAVLLFLTARFIRSQNRTHLSAMSFKEGFDTLPAGLCFYLTGGMPKMVNLSMDRLCVQITGEHLSNAEDFFSNLREAAYSCSISGGAQPMICMPDGSAYSFTHGIIEVRGEQIHELIASDITRLYRMTQDLEAKQKQIQHINTRLKALNSTMRYVIMEKEILSIKTKIHDELGKTLLLSRRWLQTPDQVDAKQMLMQWKTSFGLLLHEERETWQIPYLINRRQAELLGIDLTIQGELPEAEHLIPVIDTAMTVHTTNVMRHAEGTHAEIRIEEDAQYYILHFTNDGRPPLNGVQETGGLSNLRRMTERIGGGMKIRSLPVFELVLKLPKQPKEDDI